MSLGSASLSGCSFHRRSSSSRRISDGDVAAHLHGGKASHVSHKNQRKHHKQPQVGVCAHAAARLRQASAITRRTRSSLARDRLAHAFPPSACVQQSVAVRK
jgi:hypothetical protein